MPLPEFLFQLRKPQKRHPQLTTLDINFTYTQYFQARNTHIKQQQTEVMDRRRDNYSSSSQHHSSSSSRIGPPTGLGANVDYDGRPLPSTTHTPSAGTRMPILDRPDTAIPSVSNTLLTTQDQRMASRQTQINSLPRAERQEQEKWAQAQLKQHKTCASGCDWKKVEGGYQCNGQGNHYITHELLAEGLGGVYQGLEDDRYPHRYYWYGPLYGDE